MRLVSAIPATALLLAVSTLAWMRAPQAQNPSPKRLVARAGLGAISAIAGKSVRPGALEQTRAADPLTLSSTRPDTVAPPGAASGEAPEAEIARYHERAIARARARSRVIVADPARGGAARSSALVDFESKCSQEAEAKSAKPRCKTGALDDVPPLLGCYLQQAATALVS